MRRTFRFFLFLSPTLAVARIVAEASLDFRILEADFETIPASCSFLAEVH
jgi:hypothetical protein